ncbi:MAG: hypothetical protein ACE5KV_00470 [Thermoplasmata archaeon]
MFGKIKAIWALVIALVLVGLSTQAATVSEPEGPNMKAELPADLDFVESVELGEEGLEISDSEICQEKCEFVMIGLFVRWGLLGEERDERTPGEGGDYELIRMVPWDGFLQTTDGGVKLVRTVLFEQGGDYRLGGDDFIYPRTNRFTLEWRSSTTTHWDGLLVLVVIPKTRPMPHVTLHTEQWSHVFEAWQLIGLHRRIPVDDMGHEIEIRGFLVKKGHRDLEIAVLLFAARWGYLDDDMSHESIEMVPWDGFISVTRGAVKLVRPLRFERGGEYRLGTDDFIYPRDNRFTLEWRSSTTTNWDGVIVALIVPVTRVPELHMTFHNDQWSHIFEVRQLPGLHKRFPIDDLGHEIEINGKLIVRRPICEERILSVHARIFERGEDEIQNDVMIHVSKGERPVPGAEVYVNRRFAGRTDDDGDLFLFDLPRGEYCVIAKLDGMLGRTKFLIESG